MRGMTVLPLANVAGVRPAALALVLVLATACGGADQADPGREVVGRIVQIDRSGRDIRSFVVEEGDEHYEVFIAEDVSYGFDLFHLELHYQTGAPVRCLLERRDGRLYALRSVDAPASAAP